MTPYLKQRTYKRKNGRKTKGTWSYWRRVPKDLKHRFTSPHIQVYLNTTDKAMAKREAARINADWEVCFEAMRRGDAITAEQVERIKLGPNSKPTRPWWPIQRLLC